MRPAGNPVKQKPRKRMIRSDHRVRRCQTLWQTMLELLSYVGSQTILRGATELPVVLHLSAFRRWDESRVGQYTAFLALHRHCQRMPMVDHLHSEGQI